MATKRTGRGRHDRGKVRTREPADAARKLQSVRAREAIEGAGLLLQDVGREMGITPTTMSRKHTGESAFTIAELMVIQHLTGVDLGVRIAGMAPLPGTAATGPQLSYWGALNDVASLLADQVREIREAVRRRKPLGSGEAGGDEEAGDTRPPINRSSDLADALDVGAVTRPSPHAQAERAEEKRRRRGKQ